MKACWQLPKMNLAPIGNAFVLVQRPIGVSFLLLPFIGYASRPPATCILDGTGLHCLTRRSRIRDQLRSSEQVRELASIANKLAQRFEGC